jgi:hypothetical protein
MERNVQHVIGQDQNVSDTSSEQVRSLNVDHDYYLGDSSDYISVTESEDSIVFLLDNPTQEILNSIEGCSGSAGSAEQAYYIWQTLD